jgi:hypothetical protein
VRVSNTDTALASDLGTTVTDKAPYTCVDTLVGDCSGTASGILNVVECLTNADCGTCADCESCAECVNNTCGPRQAGFECRPSACNPADPSCCDVPEQCDGGSKTCPANMFAPASKVCRFKSAECDREERCSSTSVTCPADQKEMPGTPCADDGDVCTDDVCTCTDASCVNLTCRHPGNDVCVGCRLTGGGAVMPNNVDRTTLAAITKANFGGQVGAPCGCVGCNTNVEGSWTHNRKTKAGSFKATTFTSLACGCEVPNGALCDRAGNPDTPADVFCSSGVGQLKESGVSKTVVFRLEAVDHGEPGIGDSYRLRMWVPQTGKQSELADAVCCGKVDPKVTTSLYKSVIDDGGPLTSGNIQIHKQLRKSSDGICPPKTTCPVR